MMKEDIQIQRAELSHLPAIVEIYNEAIRQKFATADRREFSVEERISWFEEHDDLHPVFVAIIDDTVVGWYSLSAYRKGRQAFSGVREVSYYVLSTQQQRGVGTVLLDHAVLTAKKNSLDHLIAIILDRNKGSIRLLEKFGFILWGHLPDVANFDGERCSHEYYGLDLRRNS